MVVVDEDDSVVTLNTTEEDTTSPPPPTTRRGRGTGGGITRRRNADPEGERIIRRAQAVLDMAAVVDLCSPMGPPMSGGSQTITGRARGRTAAAGRRATARRGARSSSSEDLETINLDNSIAELTAAGPSRPPAPRPSSSVLDTSSNGGPSCPICLCSWTSPVSTLCGHIFCKDCIAQWVKQTKSCPVCKAGAAKLKTHPIFIS